MALRAGQSKFCAPSPLAGEGGRRSRPDEGWSSGARRLPMRRAQAIEVGATPCMFEMARICEDVELALGGWPPPERRMDGIVIPSVKSRG
jgi:hypothetical protein